MAINPQQYLGAIPTYMNQFYQPYMQAGQRALPGLEQQYGSLTNDPGGMLNRMGAGYQKSPGFDFALKQALGAADRSAARGGMAGSPMHQQEGMDIASGLASRDYDQWLQHAMGMYGMGLQGEQGLYGTGFDASKSFADQLAQTLAQQANMGFYEKSLKDQSRAGGIGGLLGGIGSLAGSFLGGPMGGMAGKSAGGGIGSFLGQFF